MFCGYIPCTPLINLWLAFRLQKRAGCHVHSCFSSLGCHIHSHSEVFVIIFTCIQRFLSSYSPTFRGFCHHIHSHSKVFVLSYSLTFRGFCHHIHSHSKVFVIIITHIQRFLSSYSLTFRGFCHHIHSHSEVFVVILFTHTSKLLVVMFTHTLKGFCFHVDSGFNSFDHPGLLSLYLLTLS